MKWSVYLVTLIGSIYATNAAEPSIAAHNGGNHSFFVKLDQSGQPLAADTSAVSRWSCVLDRRTKLVWEVKTDDNQLQDSQQTYSWLWRNQQKNGGHAGYPDKGQCSLSHCNTQNYIKAVNDFKLCASTEWRLPTREELRTLVDYTVTYPGPTIDQKFFPHTQSQFYWSSNTDASNIDSAWGIGFSFGFDYAYFKSDMGYVRLVYGPVP